MQKKLFDPNDDAFALSSLGLDPAQPFYDLNLAGAQGVPSPQRLAQPTGEHPTSIAPDFGVQNYTVPTVQPYDLTGAGITLMPAFAADPALPDLNEYAHPCGLDLTLQGISPDPQIAHDIPTPLDITQSLYAGLGFSGLDVHHALADADPLLPDLQNPDLTQQVQMPANERPGSLDPSALDVLHATLSHRQASDVSYPDVWMDQRGVNTTRTRHMSLLNMGLDNA